MGEVWGTRLLSGLKAVLHPQPQPARKRKAWPPICLAVLDMATAALLLGAGDWIDQTSGLTSVISLGGNHKLVLIMAIASFVMLATLASLTEAFAAPSDLQFALIVFFCMVSIVALSGVLAILLLAVAALIFVLLPAIVVLILVVLLGQRRR
jgi:cytochrome c oxidase subunit IV